MGLTIVLINEWYSENMGYIENCLPKALAKSDNEIHVIASTAQVYYNESIYDSVYKNYHNEKIVESSSRLIDGYTLHRLPFKQLLGKTYLLKLKQKLKQINPDIIHYLDSPTVITAQLCVLKLKFNFKLFLAVDKVYSIYPYLQNNIFSYKKFLFLLMRYPYGYITSLFVNAVYPYTIDAKEISIKYMGIPSKKIKMLYLGVDTDFFCPQINEESKKFRVAKRKELGISDEEILCIYTGRFTEGKNPLCLAKAIETLVNKGEPYKALFMGNGPQLEEIAKMKGCIVHKFEPYHTLPKYYGIADIGVWPKQESTSMIDAAACGLPIVISNKVLATERVEGNGLTYIENDSEDLANKLLELKDAALRKQLGEFGVEKIQKKYSWDKIAKEIVMDYKKFIE